MNYLSLLQEMNNLCDEEKIWNYVNHIDEHITPKELSKLIGYFISNLKPGNSVNGLDYHKLCGIRDWCDKHDGFTSRQLKFSLLTMSMYWNQIDTGYNTNNQNYGYYNTCNYDRDLDPFYDEE